MCWLRVLLLISLALELVVSAHIPKPSPNMNVYYESSLGTANAAYYFVYNKDGKVRMERGEVKISRDNKPYLVVTGTHTYTDDDGKIHTIKYTKDENEFRQQEVDAQSPEQEPVNRIDSEVVLDHNEGKIDTKDENKSKQNELDTEIPEEEPVNKIDPTLLGSLMG